MTTAQSRVDLGMKMMNRVHRFVLRLSGGRVLGSAFGMAVVDLRTVGRISGLPRSTLLTAPVIDGARVVLVASKGGDDRDPEWFRNLMARPEAELIIDGQRRAIWARMASADEKAGLWPQVVAAYPGYAEYQRRTERDIPLVICELR